MSPVYLWTELVTCEHEYKESELQTVFERWNTDRGGWNTAGVPSWLQGRPNLAFRRYFEAINYSAYRFMPDVVLESDTTDFVIELKRADKWEELALAESLHHAWWLPQLKVGQPRSNLPVVPIAVTGTSAWLRASLAYLFANGLKRTAFRHLEVTMLRTPDLARRFLWFEEPHAEWHTSELPECIPMSWRLNAKAYRLGNASAWLVYPGPIPAALPFVPMQFGMFIQLDNQSSDWLAWKRSDSGCLGRTYLLTIAENGTECNAPICPY